MAIIDPNIPTNILRVTLAERLRLKPSGDGLLVWQIDYQKGYYYHTGGTWFALFGEQSKAGAQRPNQPYIGQIFFDTTLKLIIVWDGSYWLNSSGAKV